MKYERIVTLDFETFYSAEYSLALTKYNTSEYIRDPLFKVHCAAIKVDDGPVSVYSGDALATALDGIPWDSSALLAHNTAFDGFILSEHFGIVPAYYLDTLSMARAVHSNNIRARLDDVATFYGVGNKIPDVLANTKGIRDLDPELLTKLGEYCAGDVDLCYQIYLKMLPEFTQEELDLIDLTIRMFCDPVLLVDIPRAEAALKQELDERSVLIQRSGYTIKTLRSAAQFAAALTAAGVVPPVKTSLRTGKEAYAFAKGDLEFQELRQHPNEAVRNLVEARIAAKSTINETRAIRFIQAGSFGRALPIGYKYFGAHTSRWSGSNRMNPQNLRRGGELRKSILAPAGMKIISCDSAQIEARVLAWLAGHNNLVELFRTGADVYKHQAAVIYNCAVDSVTPEQRFLGKVCVLGLGYGMGAEKFEYTLAAGLMGPPVKLPSSMCREIVSKYRLSNLQIPRLWARMEELLSYMLSNMEGEYGILRYNRDTIFLPNGIKLKYPHLTGEWDNINERYRDITYCTLEEAVQRRMGLYVAGRKLYGGLLTENVVQALARIIVANQMLEIAKKFRVVMMTHDEVVCVVDNDRVEYAEKYMKDIMSTPPEWGPDIPLSAAVSSGATYD